MREIGSNRCMDCGAYEMRYCPPAYLIRCWFPKGTILVWKEEIVYASERKGRIRWKMFKGLMKSFSGR
jgi:hypothetical protein